MDIPLCEHARVNLDSSKHAKTFDEAMDVHKIARELDEKLSAE
jgi:hypothetical protein